MKLLINFLQSHSGGARSYLRNILPLIDEWQGRDDMNVHVRLYGERRHKSLYHLHYPICPQKRLQRNHALCKIRNNQYTDAQNNKNIHQLKYCFIFHFSPQCNNYTQYKPDDDMNHASSNCKTEH